MERGESHERKKGEGRESGEWTMKQTDKASCIGRQTPIGTDR